jgi:hypothetical protein
MEQQHVIGKLLLEVQLPSRNDAFALQGALSAHCNAELGPMLAALLDSWTPPDTLLQIDKLEIDLGACSMATLQQELPALVIGFLRKHYQGIATQPSLEAGMQRRPLMQGYFESWLHFLEHGVLPPAAVKWQQEDWEAGILSALATETYALQQCRTLLENQPAAVRRLVLQFSRSFVHNWIAAYSADAQRQLLEITTAWETFVYHPQLSATILELSASQHATLPVPERTMYTDRITEWLITALIVPGRTITPGQLLEQLIRLMNSTGERIQESVVSWLYILHGSPAVLLTMSAQLRAAAATVTAQHAAAITVLQRKIKTAGDHHQARAQRRRRERHDTPGKEEGKQQQPLSSATPADSDDAGAAGGREDKDLAQSSSDATPVNKELPANIPDGEEQAISAENAGKAADDAVATADTPAEGTVYYINNAGLILLHPYLSFFFDALALREGKQFKNEAAAHRAVQLLGYLAYGEENIPEYDLVLPKLLCGILPATPVRRFIPLSDVEKTEANELLSSVISHWNALGNTSPDGLRGNFLMREGKLEWKEDEWQLYVTQQSFDMLLNRLPWGFSVVGLSWMPWLIKTVWV